MVKQSKSLKKLAAKAEIAAARFDDPEISSEMRSLASAYRSQASIVKQKEKVVRKLSTIAKPKKTKTASKTKTKVRKRKRAG